MSMCVYVTMYVKVCGFSAYDGTSVDVSRRVNIECNI